MDFLGNLVLGALAAAGLLCVLWCLYQALFLRQDFGGCRIRLTLRGDGQSPDTEQLLRTAAKIRELYFKDMEIVFEEQGNGVSSAERLAQGMGIEYCEDAGQVS